MNTKMLSFCVLLGFLMLAASHAWINRIDVIQLDHGIYYERNRLTGSTNIFYLKEAEDVMKKANLFEVCLLPVIVHKRRLVDNY